MFHIAHPDSLFSNLIWLVLLSLFLFNTGGYFFYSKILQFAVRQEIRTQIRGAMDEKDLCVISVPSDNQHMIRWEEKDREFSYKGELYDVVRKEIRCNTTCYYCINDKKETRIISNLVRNNHENSRIQKILKRIVSMHFIPNHFSVGEVLSNAQIQYPQRSAKYSPFVAETGDPPPEAT
jgi:hypothetical protein